jgi:hypothetical protein
MKNDDYASPEQLATRKLLKYVVPFWIFNALALFVAFFAYSWCEHNNHWAADAWYGVTTTWIFIKAGATIWLIALTNQAYFGR